MGFEDRRPVTSDGAFAMADGQARVTRLLAVPGLATPASSTRHGYTRAEGAMLGIPNDVPAGAKSEGSSGTRG
jgi:hypothetical protein